MKISHKIKLFHDWFFTIVKIWPHLAILHLPQYFRDRKTFIKKGGYIRWSDSLPCLMDRNMHTPFDSHYFYQSAWLGRRLSKIMPTMHIDIGSDIRMINVLSAFIPTEFIDYRPLVVNLQGLKCRTGNILGLFQNNQSVSSLSSLHVIEHVGLGRYGEPIDPEGSLKAAAELERILAIGGFLYVSVPVGKERVCFNAHRVFNPIEVQNLFPNLKLREFSFVDDSGRFHEYAMPYDAKNNDYACGMYIFYRQT